MRLLRNIPTAIKYLFDGEVPFKKKILLILGIIYFISPIDLIPEPVIGLGIIDDVALITYILSKLSADLEEYRLKKYRKNKDEEIKDKIIEDVDYDIKDE